MKPGTRLTLAGALIAGTTAYMGYVGAASSWKYYVTVDECLAADPVLTGARLRVNGRVAAGSLCITADRSGATFRLHGTESELRVTLTGYPPDNLVEEREVVAEGYIEGHHHLRADRVMTRCASKYTSPNSETANHERQALAQRGS